MKDLKGHLALRILDLLEGHKYYKPSEKSTPVSSLIFGLDQKKIISLKGRDRAQNVQKRKYNRTEQVSKQFPIGPKQESAR